jgi:hypothetical protein
MRIFYVADLTVQGELRDITEYDYAALERIPGASDVIARCSGEIWKNPEQLDVILSELGKTQLRWRATSASAGVATVRRADGGPVSISLVVAGRDVEADATTLSVMQQHLVRELRQTPFEPAFDLIQIKQRPLIATMTFASGTSSEEPMIEAIADRCFAAAYFRYLGLA